MRILSIILTSLCLCTLNIRPCSAKENTFLPALQFTLTPTPLGKYGLLSFLGEAGNNSLRSSATLGAEITNFQRAKVTAEALSQNLKYQFLTGDVKKWLYQYAIGTKYEYLLVSPLLRSLDAGGWYSNVPSRILGDDVPLGGGLLERHIAGSHGGGGYVGSTILLWGGAFGEASIHYDWVRYRRIFEYPMIVKGWGGSLRFIQHLKKDISLIMRIDMRRPFNFYEAKINWDCRLPSTAVIEWGLFGSITEGKRGVSDAVAAGIKIGYAWGDQEKRCCFSPSVLEHAKKYPYYDPQGWISTPAVYMPVVLAVADERFTAPAPPPPPPPPPL